MIYLHGNSSSRVEALTIVEYLLPNNIAVCGIDLSGILFIIIKRFWIIIGWIYFLRVLWIKGCKWSLSIFEIKKSKWSS